MVRARLLCSMALSVCIAGVAGAATPDIKVTLLGTGGPAPKLSRFGPATLVEAGGEKILIDCGRGATQRLWQLHINLSAVTAVFLTHLHSDHTVGIPDLWLTGWLPPRFGGRTAPFLIWGPAGTRDLMTNLERAYAWDIQARIADEKLPRQGIAVTAVDIGEGVVYEKNGVKVAAFEVDHGDVLKPALGYRIDYHGHSVVISGDTRPTENLIRFSKGTDVLIHEVALAGAAALSESESARRIIAHHTRPEEAGSIFDRVRPKLAVYSHIVILGDDSPAAIAQLLAATRKTYDGPLRAGEDLMTIEIGSTVRTRISSARIRQRCVLRHSVLQNCGRNIQILELEPDSARYGYRHQLRHSLEPDAP